MSRCYSHGVAADTELLDGWARGDDAAGKALYERHGPRVVRFFARKTHDDVADLVQRTFLKLLNAKTRGDQIGDVPALLFTVARNELYDRYRKNAALATRFDPEVTTLADVAASRTGPSTWAAREEERRRLLDALAELPLDTQLAIELYYWEELSMDDVARALGISRSAAINRIHRARQQIGEKLRDPEAIPDLRDPRDR